MTFLDAYARFGPDTLAIADALDIKEHEADTLINLHMEKLHQLRRQPKAMPAAKIRYAGYDGTAHLLGESGDRREW